MDSNIQKYQAFVTTAQLGSFTKAAQALSYTQSAISRMVADLERDWNLTLLERGRGGVRLTSDGLALLPYAQHICDDQAELASQVDALHGIESGLVRIGTFSSVASQWLPRIIGAFQADHPHIAYELVLGDYAEIERWVDEGRVDCGFTRLPAGRALDATPIAQDELLAVLPVGHPLAALDAVPLASFEGEPFLLLEKDDNVVVSDLLTQSGVTPDVKFTTWDDNAVMAMVEEGLGLAILPSLVLQRVAYDIVTRPLDTPAFRQIGFIVRNRHAMPRAVARFATYLNRREKP